MSPFHPYESAFLWDFTLIALVLIAITSVKRVSVMQAVIFKEVILRPSEHFILKVATS